MNFLRKYLVSPFGEILIIFFFLVLTNNYLGNRNNLIEADGRGYYEFLPATFIYHDLSLSYLDTLQTEFYDNKMMANDFYPRLENGNRFDKYFIGTAVMQAPFFAIGHLWASLSDKHVEDGFSRPYQISIYIAALFYTFFALIFIRKTFQTWNVNRFWIFIAQASVLYCSSLMDYIHWDAAYSHCYSFFLIAGFIYFARIFLTQNTRKSLFWAIIFLGLIFFVRPVNILILLFLPMLAENFKDFVQSLKSVFTTYLKTLLLATLVVICFYQIQCIVWYIETGHWFHYSYGDETFIWSESHFMDFLFSYRKGFFLWAPWFFVLVVCAVLFHVFRKSWYRLVTFLAAFSLLIYVLSSWWYWSYGGSIGSRPMIDFYPALLAFAAPLFAIRTGFLKWVVLALTPALAYLMIIQTYQYQRFIFTLDSMNETTYWKIFLKTEPMYIFYLWKTQIPVGQQISETPWVKHQKIQPDRWFTDTVSVENPIGSEPKVGQITFISKQKTNAELLEIRLLGFNDSLLYNTYNNMLHVVDEPKGNQFIDFRFELKEKLPEKFRAVFVIQTKESPVTIDSMKIRFFTN